MTTEKLCSALLRTLVFAGLTVLTPAKASDCLPVPSGLVGWWSGDENSLDLSGRFNHGQSSGLSYSAGKVQTAFDFNGANSSVRIMPAPELEVASLTFAAWINPRDGDYRPILTYQRDNDYRGALFWTGKWAGDETTGSLYANLRERPGRELVIEAAGVIPTNQWSFVAVTYDRDTGFARLYVNDVVVKEATFPQFTPDTVGPLYIGHCPVTSVDQFNGRVFNGGIDEAQVFNRALSQADLNQIYLAGSVGICKDALPPLSFTSTHPILLATNDLVSVYPLNGNADDSSGHGFNGTLFGTTVTADRFGRTNGALYFNGTNDYVDLGNRPEFNFTNGFTLNAWVKTDGGANAYVIGKYSYQGPGLSESRSYGLGVHEGLGPYGFVLGDGIAYQDLFAYPTLEDGQWHAITLSYENGAGVRLFADGQLKGTRFTGDLPPFTNNLPLLIGKIASGLNFKGSIDDISIYNRALDDSEVRLLHNYQRFYQSESPVLLRQPTATFSQVDFSVSNVTDGVIDSSTAWGIYPAITNQTAVFETAAPVGFQGGTVFNFNLVFNHPSVPGTTSHALGRFRLSATTDSTDTFADGLASGGDVSANWSDFAILSATATSGATLTVLPDNSLLVSGNISLLDTYTVYAATRLTGVTGLRLEVLQDSSLPFNGPGREPLNGNFALSEMLIAVRPGGFPLITNQPSSITVTNGGAANFEVGFISAIPVTYQWFLNGAPIVGGTNASFSVENSDFTHAGTYSVRLDNAEGATFSSGAVLNVIPSDSSGLAAVFVSNFQPTNAPISDIAGQLLAGPDYLAQVYAGPDADSLVPQSPAVPFLTGDDAGYFGTIAVLLTNVVQGFNAFVQVRVWESAAGSSFDQARQGGGQHGASAILETATGGGTIPTPYLDELTSFSLVAAPRILAHPAGDTVYVGEEALFQVQTWGSGPLAYQWFLESNSITGATSSTLTLTNLQVDQGGGIYVVVMNSAGAITSSVATLTVLVPDVTAPEITIISPAVGTTFETSVTLSGSIADDRGIASAFWQRNGQLGGEITLENGQFSITNLSLARGANVFRVTATDTSDNTGTAEVIITNVASRAVYVGEVSPHQEGARVSVPLFLESRGDVGGVRFTLAYDRNVLTEPEIQWESPIGGAVTSSNTNQPGTVIGTFVLSGTTVSTGAVQFATLTFRSRSVPINTTVQLWLTVTGLFNDAGDPLSPVGTDVRSGTVQIKVRKFKGDNNANDRLDVGDAATIMRFDNLLEFPRPWDAPKNDLNNNAQLDAGDVIRVLRAVVGLDPQPSVPGPQSLGATAFLPSAATSGRLTLQLDKLTAAAGDEVKLAVQLSQYSGPLAAASLKLQFPTNALKLLNSTSHRTGSIVPAGAAILWNVVPAQNNYAIQNGAIALAVSSDRNWTTNQGVLAEFTFVVQPGATNNHQWPITLSQGEISTGLDVLDVSGGEIFFVGREAVAPQFSAAPVLTENGLALSFSAEVGIRYRIEVSEDLTNWLPLATVTGDGATLNVTDAEAALADRRFYRAIQVD